MSKWKDLGNPMGHDRNHSGLTPAEAERLAVLIEECGEVIQAATKVLRHGYNGEYPTGQTNRAQLELEMADALFAIELCGQSGDVAPEAIHNRLHEKPRLALQHLHHQNPDLVLFKKEGDESGETSPHN